MEHIRSQPSEIPETNEQIKQPYATPQLTVHGAVEELTRQLGASIADGFTASN